MSYNLTESKCPVFPCVQSLPKMGKKDNLQNPTNNHRYGCREGKGSDIFDNHVYNCKGPSLQEPLFRMYVLMTCSSYDKLLNIERRLHLKGFDTTFRLV